MNANPITAKDVLALLEAKHARDVCFSEVNLGSKWKGCQRLDFWAMPRSWAKWRIIAYEVKVSRSDFLNDDKWRSYLAHAHEFSFVAPSGIISRDELPDGIGLYEVSKTGKRLFTRRKPIHRTDSVDPVDAMAYLLMSRVVPGNPNGPTKSTLDYWREWLAEKEERRGVGYRVSVETAKLVRRLEVERDEAKIALDRVRRLEEAAQKHGINLKSWNPEGELRRVRESVGGDLVEKLKSAHDRLGQTLAAIETLGAPQ